MSHNDRPTHWMDDRGLHVSDRWLQSDEATSDYRAEYVIPAKMTRAGVRPLYPCRTCSGTGKDITDGDPCRDCGGSGGTKGAARTDDTAPAAGERHNVEFSGRP